MRPSTSRIALATLVVLLCASGTAYAAAPAPAPTASPTPAAKVLDTVVVTAQRHPVTLRSTSRETYVITRADLERFGSPTIAQALSFLPGVYVKTSGAFGGVESALIRGASSEQTLVLIDGRPAGDADLGDFDFTSLASDAVERVEVVEGGSSTLYGSNAVGGVINIITAGAGQKTGGSAYEQTGYEGANAMGLRASAGDLHTLASTLTMRSSSARDTFDYPGFLSIPAGVRTDDDARDNDTTLSLARKLGAVTASVRLGDDATDFGAPGDLEFCQAPPNDAFCPSGLARQQRVWNRSDAELAWTAGAHDLSLQAYADGRRLHFFDPAPSFPYDTFTSLATRGVGLRDAWTLNASQVLVAGFDSRGDVASFGASYAPKVTLARDATTAWYAEDDVHPPSSAFSYAVGVRREQPQGTNGVTVPSIGVEERLGDAGLLRADYARSFRTPTLDERYYPGFGTPTLQPEYGATFDAGLTRALGVGLVGITYFGTDTNNLIVDVPIDAFGDVAPENVARARVRGLDASYRVPIGAYAITASYTDYPVARDLTLGTRLFYRPSSTGGLQLERAVDGGRFGIDLRETGRRFADESNTTSLPPFATLGAFASRSLGAGTSITLRADNLTGERVQETYGYPVMGPTMSLTLAQTWPR